MGAQRLASVQENQPPIADPGPDRSAHGGETVVLDAASSSDPDGTITAYAWQQSAGTAVTLDDATSPQARFTAPVLAAAETLAFTLTVTDSDGERTSADIAIEVQPNSPPEAVIAAETLALAGEPIILDGSASHDLEGPLTYRWHQQSTAGIVLNHRYTAIADIEGHITGSHYTVVMALTVTDSMGASDTAEIAIEVLDPDLDADADGLADALEIIHFGDIAWYGADDDPDGDGLSNRQELAEGTDPNSAEPIPETPLGLAAAGGDGQVLVRWSKAIGVAAYNLYWSSAPIDDLTQAHKLSGVTSPYLHQGLANATRYYYQLSAENALGESAPTLAVNALPAAGQWRGPEPVIASAGSKLRLAGDGAGNLFLAWVEDGVWVMRLRPGIGWSAPHLLCGAKALYLALAASASGDAIVAWVEQDGEYGDDLYGAVYRFDTDSWGAAQDIDGYSEPIYDADQVSEPVVAMHADGWAIAAWLQWDLRVDGNYIRSYDTVYAAVMDADGHWGEREQLEIEPGTNDSEAPVLAMASDGESAIAWTRRLRDGDDSNQLYLRGYRPGVGWRGTTEAVAPDGIDVEYGAVPAMAVNAAGQLLLAWNSGLDIQAIVRGGDGSWGALAELSNKDTDGSDAVSAMLDADGSADVRALEDHYGKLGGFVYDGQGWAYDGLITRRKDSVLPSFARNSAGAGVLAWRESDIAHFALYDPATGWGQGVQIDPEPLPYSLLPTRDLIGGHAYAWRRDGAIWVKRWDSRGERANEPPWADAGPDLQAAAGEIVQLDAGASFDPDGEIAAYEWVPYSGSALILSDPARPTPSFTAPRAGEASTIAVRLNVTDDSGAGGSDTLTIAVAADPALDVTAPLTIPRVIVETIKGANHYDITLTPDEPATTWFRHSGDGTLSEGGEPGGAWQVYSIPLHVINAKRGSSLIEYYSVDAAGNQEAIRSRTLQ